MTKSIEKKVALWLKKQGYPLEMEVASTAKSCGFDISQSDYYLDPEGGEAREIDLVGSIRKNLSGFNMAYSLFVECKSSRDKPWLLFSTENYLLNSSVASHRLTTSDSFITNDLGYDLLLHSVSNRTIQNLYPRLDTEPTLAYGVTQAFTDHCEAPFKALMSSSKAALSHINRFGSIGLGIPFIVAIPLVVIDVPMFSIIYSPSSHDLLIKEIKLGAFLWKHVVAGRSRIGIYIVHHLELESFLMRCKNGATWWTSIEENTLRQIHQERYGPKSLE